MQKWRQEGGLFRNMADPGKCLDAFAPTARQDGGKVVVWSCWGGPMQQWMPSPVVSETMTDRCSGDVFFPAQYNQAPQNGVGGIYLRRGPSGWTNWTPIFHQNLDEDHHVRWWCHSTTGNWLDPGTWRFRDVNTVCQASGGDLSDFPEGADEHSEGSFTITTFDVNGWTAERSRCDSRTDFFQARLGPDRLLETRCIQP